MVLIYQGKLNHLNYALNEHIVIVLPRGLRQGEDACAYWQWSVDGSEHPKTNMHYEDRIDSVKGAAGGSWDVTLFSKEFYTFTGKMSADGNTLTLTLAHGNEQSQPMTLKRVYDSSLPRYES
jgi:hypothetical protein